jgi:uncharacterized damage-inducible protein DinB
MSPILTSSIQNCNSYIFCPYFCYMETAKQVLQRLNAYQLKVNADMLGHLEMVEAGNERIALLISHMINSHQIWIERIQLSASGVQVFDTRSYTDLKEQNHRNYEGTELILNEKDMEAGIAYVNTKGRRFVNTIGDIFLHVFNHSTYHRGQINQLLVQEGKKPMVSDFIVYNRTEIFEL